MHYLCIHAIQNSLPEMNRGKLQTVEKIGKMNHILPLEGDILNDVHLNPSSFPVTHTLDAVGQIVHTIMFQPGGQNLIPNTSGGRLDPIFHFTSVLCHIVPPPFRNLHFTHEKKDGILSLEKFPAF